VGLLPRVTRKKAPGEARRSSFGVKKNARGRGRKSLEEMKPKEKDKGGGGDVRRKKPVIKGERAKRHARKGKWGWGKKEPLFVSLQRQTKGDG